MKCRDERNWPPQWKGPYGPHHPLPSGEVGVLSRVSRPPGFLDTPHCIIVIEWNDQEYFASVYFDDADFMETVFKLLQDSIGHPMTEIGSLDIPE
jgi:hypothetical protein